MATQTITLTADADDGYEGAGSVWNTSGASGFDYVAGATAGLGISAFSFILTAAIKGNATVNRAFIRLNSTTDNVGSIALEIKLENQNPKTNTAPGASHLPSGMSFLTAHAVASTAYASNVFYFGQADTNATNLARSLQTLLYTYGDLPIGARITVILQETGNNGNYASFDDSSLGANDPQLILEWTDPSDGNSLDDDTAGEDDALSSDMVLGSVWFDYSFNVAKWFDPDLTDTVAAGGTTFFQDVSGTLTPVGELIKQTNKTLSGTLTTSGALIKQTQRALTATLTLAGELLKQTQKILEGTLTTSGALTSIRLFAISLTATLNMSGDLVKQTNKVLAGTLGLAGAISKITSKLLSGTLAMSGTLLKQTQRALTATLTMAGALATLYIPVFAGSSLRNIGRRFLGFFSGRR